MSLKETILAVSDAALEPVDVPEWKTTVYVKAMSGTERDAWEGVAFPGGKPRDTGYRVSLLLFTLCDDQGKRIFADTDLDLLSGKRASVLNRLYDVAARINGLRKVDEDDAAKNS